MRSLTSRSIAASTHCPLKIRLRPSPTAVHAATYNNEAENLYKGIPLSEGLINKRLTEKQMSKENKEFVSAMKLAEDESEKELLLRRETRTAPTNNEEIVESTTSSTQCRKVSLSPSSTLHSHAITLSL